MQFTKNILKIADVDADDLSPEIISYLKGFVYYEDTVLSEDIFSVADALQSDHFAKLTALDQFILQQIHRETEESKCAYIRILYQLNKPQVTPQVEITNEPLPGESPLKRELKAAGLKINMKDWDMTKEPDKIIKGDDWRAHPERDRNPYFDRLDE